MNGATARDPRNHGGKVIQGARRGERITGTRNGGPVTEPRPRTSAAVLIERFASLPVVDPDRLRADIDAIVDQSL